MRAKARLQPWVPAGLLLAIALLSPGCGNSDSITGPSTGTTTSASISGTWSGNYKSNNPAGCSNSAATAVFSQDGATVTGTVTTSACGVTGVFKGSLQGSMVTGRVSMAGCVGGIASGAVNGSELVFSIGDLTKPLLKGDETVGYGGTVTLHR